VPRERDRAAPEMRFRRCEISAQQVPLCDIEMGFAARLGCAPDQIEGVLRGNVPQEQFQSMARAKAFE